MFIGRLPVKNFPEKTTLKRRPMIYSYVYQENVYLTINRWGSISLSIKKKKKKKKS